MPPSAPGSKRPRASQIRTRKPFLLGIIATPDIFREFAKRIAQTAPRNKERKLPGTGFHNLYEQSSRGTREWRGVGGVAFHQTAAAQPQHAKESEDEPQ